MTATDHRTNRSGPNLFHAVMLAGTTPLFLGAMLCDYAYSMNYHTQWATFASWLNLGGLIFAGLALLCAIVGFVRSQDHRLAFLMYPALLLLTWIIGLVNAFAHARDTWAMMPAGFTLSIVVVLLAGMATWVGFSRFGIRDKP
ncbi:membrane protein [Halovibrio variabilis]|uniref:Membrane protein n=1 Tax=Halovibrio variabilis TaxID=31910 RepID=A0A511UVK9_9GAMM|nr:hypothetical protein [Halovibrio variabilis]GEN29182.1 membrane protein [Halovibrio variabilis]